MAPAPDIHLQCTVVRIYLNTILYIILYSILLYYIKLYYIIYKYRHTHTRLFVALFVNLPAAVMNLHMCDISTLLLEFGCVICGSPAHSCELAGEVTKAVVQTVLCFRGTWTLGSIVLIQPPK